MTIDRRDSNSQLASRLTIVSYPAEIVACLLPELNGICDQPDRISVIQSNSNQQNPPSGPSNVARQQMSSGLVQQLHCLERRDEPTLAHRLDR